MSNAGDRTTSLQSHRFARDDVTDIRFENIDGCDEEEARGLRVLKINRDKDRRSTTKHGSLLRCKVRMRMSSTLAEDARRVPVPRRSSRRAKVEVLASIVLKTQEWQDGRRRVVPALSAPEALPATMKFPPASSEGQRHGVQQREVIGGKNSTWCSGFSSGSLGSSVPGTRRH
ncbi:hypothetical protein B0H11DRAFT_1932936 [Mycena galericulata]|nr:hypothetical protein B0H11DRAFT_1932936 [Mycena galericulata]